jgi:hypothetical protein
MPKSILGKWCYDYKSQTYGRGDCDDLNIMPDGYSTYIESGCHLKSIRKIGASVWMLRNRCEGEGMRARMTVEIIGIDKNGRLVIEETHR